MLSNVEFQALEDTDPDRVYTIPGGSSDSGMGISEYLQYKQEVESKLRATKADYAACARKVSGLKETLLDRYQKLFTLVTQRDQRDAERKETLDSEALLKARQREFSYKAKLMAEITELERETHTTDAQFRDAQTFLSDFLKENSGVLSAVEKAEAQDTEHRRRELREKAHEQIIEAFQGGADAAGGTQTFKLMRELRDNSSATKDLRTELEALRKYEETTDDLVERLRIKVESIDLLEESQVEMIDSQLSKQRRLGRKIRDLQQQVDKNNQELVMIVDKVEMEIGDQLGNIISTTMLTFLCCSLVLIFGIVFGSALYYVLTVNQ